jgi:hypothetical protein
MTEKAKPCIGDLISYYMLNWDQQYIGMIIDTRGTNVRVRWAGKCPLGYAESWLPRNATTIISTT